MKKLILVGLLVALAISFSDSNAQYYRNKFEAGDTLVSNTADTSATVLIYQQYTSTKRYKQFNLWIGLALIGASNSTHDYLQVKIDGANESLSAAADGWVEMGKVTVGGTVGALVAGEDIIIPLDKMLAIYSPDYIRVILKFPNGIADDSSTYKLILTAEKGGN